MNQDQPNRDVQNVFIHPGKVRDASLKLRAHTRQAQTSGFAEITPPATAVNGWAPPLVHDRETQRPRIATQDDIDRMEMRLGELERFWRETRRLLEQTQERTP